MHSYVGLLGDFYYFVRLPRLRILRILGGPSRSARELVYIISGELLGQFKVVAVDARNVKIKEVA